MAELPKFARTRLEQPNAGPHPDANLISAFVENALSQRERAHVLQHLATCAECRAVAGLAMPELEELPVVAPTPEQRSWARWTMMRWVTLATSAVVIAIAVLVLRPHQPPIQTYAVPSVSESSPAVVPDVQDKANSQSQSPGAADKTEKEQQAKPA